jgi:hypothetical protein
MGDPVPLAEQIRCVGRELGRRRSVYPNWGASGWMKPADANREIVTMEAVLATLKGLGENCNRRVQNSAGPGMAMRKR